MRPSGSSSRSATARHERPRALGPQQGDVAAQDDGGEELRARAGVGEVGRGLLEPRVGVLEAGLAQAADRRDVVGEQVGLGHVAQGLGVRVPGRDVTGHAQGPRDVARAAALRHQAPAGRERREQAREEALVVEDPVEGGRRHDQVDRRLDLQLQQVALAHAHPGGQVGQLARGLGDHPGRAVDRLDGPPRDPLGDDPRHPSGAAAGVEDVARRPRAGSAPPPAGPRRPGAPTPAGRCRHPTRRPSGASAGFAHHDGLNLSVRVRPRVAAAPAQTSKRVA